MSRQEAGGAFAAGEGARGLRVRAGVRAFARALGLDVKRWNPAASPNARRHAALRDEGVNVALDVGAHKGEFVRELRVGGYSGRVVSFEPLAEPYGALSRSAESDPGWECHKLAIGDTDGDAQMHVTAYSGASSLLPPARGELDARPQITRAGFALTGSERVRVARLDSVEAQVLHDDERALLKLDVHGYELRALRGASSALHRVRVVETELLLTDLYEDQVSAAELLAELYGRGFECISLDAAFVDPASGYLLAADGLFIRRHG